MNFVQQIESFIKDNDLCTPSDKVLIAVSGGVDSMVLLEILVELEYDVSIAHCNFSLRGRESNKDEELVRNVSKEKEVKAYFKKFNTTEYVHANKLSIQEAARELRYEWFQELVTEFSFDKIAVAHHLDDSIETVLINLKRNTGPKGLRGILAKRDNIIRPLIDSAKEDILKYAEENKIRFRDDASNIDTKYLRNKIRHEVIPALKEQDGEFYSTWRKKLELAIINWDLLAEQIDRTKDLCLRKKGSQIVIDIQALKTQEGYSLLLFHLLENLGFSAKQRTSAIDLLDSQSGKVIMGKSHIILKDREELIILENKSNDFFFEIEEGQKELNGYLELLIQDILPKDLEIKESKNIAYFDGSRLEYPLVIRNWKKGDQFHPFGMKGKKKVSDLFIDHKIDIQSKTEVPIMLSGENIIWVMGMRTSDKFKVEKDTTKILKIEWIKDE